MNKIVYYYFRSDLKMKLKHFFDFICGEKLSFLKIIKKDLLF